MFKLRNVFKITLKEILSVLYKNLTDSFSARGYNPNLAGAKYLSTSVKLTIYSLWEQILQIEHRCLPLFQQGSHTNEQILSQEFHHTFLWIQKIWNHPPALLLPEKLLYSIILLVKICTVSTYLMFIKIPFLFLSWSQRCC